MKKLLIYLLGVISGVIITFIFAMLLSSGNGDTNKDLTWFDKPGEVISEQSFEVFQVLDNHVALVHGKSTTDLYLGTVYLLTNNDGKYYYDKEIVKVPSDKVVRHVGIYKYQTNMNVMKTVPVIQIMNK